MNSVHSLFLNAVAPTIVETLERPARAARFADAPSPYDKGDLAGWIRTMTGQSRLWHHQAIALRALEDGVNVVLATSTASGKSLPFMARAIRLLKDNPQARIIAFYPQKALGSDQQARWENALELAGLDRSLVGEITGDTAMGGREHVIERARILLMTPDVAHSWLMRMTSAPATQATLAYLSLVIIDEAHAYDGVFGTSSAMFFRRLHLAVARAQLHKNVPQRVLQYMAATATIANPAEHLMALTSQPFQAITEDDNGAPCHGTTMMHIEGPDYGQVAEKMLADTIEKLAGTIAPDAVIAFADGRQLVERVTKRVDRDDVLPYRSGYEARDRRSIEQSLRDGKLRAVVSTSALELGVDLPQFVIGINLGVPVSRKSLQQRAGRVGRSKPAVFVVIAPAAAFAKLGTTFEEYMKGAAEPAHLYLDNPIIQFQQARCLLEETVGEVDLTSANHGVTWPDGFKKAVEWAKPGAARPSELDSVASNGSDSPHLAYSLRHLSGEEFILREGTTTSDPIGKIEIVKALREAYPGATYRHMKHTYFVKEWRRNPYERTIVLQLRKNLMDTRPALRLQVNASLLAGAILGKRIKAGPHGALAEISMRVVESVEGRFLGNTYQSYRDLGANDRRMVRKAREFETTGILLRIAEPWFQGDGDAARETRRKLGEALVAVLCREYSLAASDINHASTNVVIVGADGSRKSEDSLAIFDTVPGGLRLTSPLFDDLGNFLERLEHAANVAGSEALISAWTAQRAKTWLDALSPSQGENVSLYAANDTERLVYAPNSEVLVRLHGNLLSRVLIAPELVNIADQDQLMYRYNLEGGGTGLVAASSIVDVAGDCHQVLWDSNSGTMKELAA